MQTENSREQRCVYVVKLIAYPGRHDRSSTIHSKDLVVSCLHLYYIDLS